MTHPLIESLRDPHAWLTPEARVALADCLERQASEIDRLKAEREEALTTMADWVHHDDVPRALDSHIGSLILRICEAERRTLDGQ